MCEFPSWIEDNDGKVWFLTDKDIERYHENTTNEICWQDFVGHSGIKKVFGINGKHIEGFENMPDKIVSAIKSGKMKKIMKTAMLNKIEFFDNKVVCVVGVGGDQHWYKEGELHRDNDKPAIVCAYGGKYWYKEGLKHRDNDLPAIIYASGDQHWYKEGVFQKKTNMCEFPSIVNAILRNYQRGINRS